LKRRSAGHEQSRRWSREASGSAFGTWWCKCNSIVSA